MCRFFPIVYIYQFPYYIVRFKPGVAKNALLGKKSFHTTQYDLNDSYISIQVSQKYRFHTTQYDLNSIQDILTKNPELMFPYYIVRFKPVDRQFKIIELFLFPYYIVRFKLLYRLYRYLLEMQFPYYIVRFKRYLSTALGAYQKQFPYYIVRFKLYHIKYINKKIKVSILHSTI